MPDVNVNTQEVIGRIDTLIRLFAIAVTDGKKWSEKIAFLSKAGLKPKEIAELLGTTSNAVRVELSRIRKRG